MMSRNSMGYLNRSRRNEVRYKNQKFILTMWHNVNGCFIVSSRPGTVSGGRRWGHSKSTLCMGKSKGLRKEQEE